MHDKKKGLIKPGGIVVEGTAGNTGIGLAHICRARVCIFSSQEPTSIYIKKKITFFVSQSLLSFFVQISFFFFFSFVELFLCDIYA